MDTSKAEQMQGFNISYENSFTAIKRDIVKETIDKNKRRQKASNPHSNVYFDVIDEKVPVTNSARYKAGTASSKVSSSGNRSKDHASITEYLSKTSAGKASSTRPKTQYAKKSISSSQNNSK